MTTTKLPFVTPRKTDEEIRDLVDLRRRAGIHVKSYQQTRKAENHRAIRESLDS